MVSRNAVTCYRCFLLLISCPAKLDQMIRYVTDCIEPVKVYFLLGSTTFLAEWHGELFLFLDARPSERS